MRAVFFSHVRSAATPRVSNHGLVARTTKVSRVALRNPVNEAMPKELERRALVGCVARLGMPCARPYGNVQTGA